MTRRRPRRPEDAPPVLLETPPKTSKKTSSSSPAALVLIVTLTVGACSIMGWLYVQQQQHSIDQLSDSFTTMNQRITNFQQVMDTQSDPGLLVEERIFALEEAQKQAQQDAEEALASSEQLRTSDLSQLWALHAEINHRWDEIKHAALSVSSLQGVFKNQSEELEVTKQRVQAGLTFSSALSDSVASLTSSCSRVTDQITSVEALNAQLEGQESELDELRELLDLHQAALHSHNQEISAVKELVKAKQAMRVQALEETLSSVRMTLDEQFFTSQTLHSRIMTQLHTFHSQLASGPSNHKSTEEDRPAENQSQDVSELQENMEDTQEEAEQNIKDDTEEDLMQEEENMERDVTETQEEEEETASEEEVEEEMMRQSEEQEDETEEEEKTSDHMLEDPLEENASKEDEI